MDWRNFLALEKDCGVWYCIVKGTYKEGNNLTELWEFDSSNRW